jgi:hypothetical protein
MLGSLPGQVPLSMTHIEAIGAGAAQAQAARRHAALSGEAAVWHSISPLFPANPKLPAAPPLGARSTRHQDVARRKQFFFDRIAAATATGWMAGEDSLESGGYVSISARASCIRKPMARNGGRRLPIAWQPAPALILPLQIRH